MARKNYSEEFRRQAVDLYESTPGATVRGIAEDVRGHEKVPTGGQVAVPAGGHDQSPVVAK